MKHKLVATCLFGFEKTLKYELNQIGLKAYKTEDGRVFFEGRDEDIARVNVYLRTAERVMINLGSFKATSFEELYSGVRSLDLSKYFDKNSAFPISKVRSVKSKLTSQRYVQSVSKKAVADNLMESFKVDELNERGAEIPISVFIFKDKVHFYIDTSGDSLHKRGYREKTVLAPLRETIAAFMVMSTVWNPSRPFADLMCGSGTIPIEAALIGMDRKPGVNRKFRAMEYPFIDGKVWDKVRADAINGEKNLNFKITAWDKDPNAIDIAKENARLAGVIDHIDFKCRDLSGFRSKDSRGIMVSNPPYGERIEEVQLQQLYTKLKSVISNLDSWCYYFITSDENITKELDITFQKNRKVYNSGITTRIYEYLAPKKLKTSWL